MFLIAKIDRGDVAVKVSEAADLILQAVQNADLLVLLGLYPDIDVAGRPAATNARSARPNDLG